jgi:hypothetical protein
LNPLLGSFLRRISSDAGESRVKLLLCFPSLRRANCSSACFRFLTQPTLLASIPSLTRAVDFWQGLSFSLAVFVTIEFNWRCLILIWPARDPFFLSRISTGHQSFPCQYRFWLPLVDFAPGAPSARARLAIFIILLEGFSSACQSVPPDFVREGFIACAFGVVFAARCAARQSAPKIFLLPLDKIFTTCARLHFRELAFVS